MSSNKTKLYLIFAFLAVTLLVLIFGNQQIKRDQFSPKLVNELELTIGSEKFILQVALSPESHYQGLSGQNSLCPNCGMLFIFPEKQDLGFVMRRMNFPLDIIFLADDRIVNIYQNLEPEGDEPEMIYQSLEPANYVIELNGGRASELDLNVGDRIKLF